jgi:hypothetical protein
MKTDNPTKTELEARLPEIRELRAVQVRSGEIADHLGVPLRLYQKCVSEWIASGKLRSLRTAKNERGAWAEAHFEDIRRMREEEGLSTREIAEALDVSLGTMSSVLARWTKKGRLRQLTKDEKSRRMRRPSAPSRDHLLSDALAMLRLARHLGPSERLDAAIELVQTESEQSSS